MMVDLSGARSVYLDTSALCRVFDDQSQSRVRLETEAVLVILETVQEARLRWIVSPALISEVRAIPGIHAGRTLLLMISELGIQPKVDVSAWTLRAERIRAGNVSRLDAYHVAFAEIASASFVTCDDRLLRSIGRIGSSVWIGGPLAFCEEEFRQ